MNQRELLNKYFEGTLSKEEVLPLLTFLSEDDGPDSEALFLEIWNSYESKAHFDARESQNMLGSLKRKIQMEQEDSISRRGQRFWIGAAAAVSALLICFVGLSYFTRVDSKTHFASGYGETRHLVLPDGSEVTLNANSSITYFDNWNEQGNAGTEGFVREVWLDGEAFFSVERKDIAQRFVVFTDEVEVEVLGTTFNVNSRRNRTQVLLKSGQVKLNIKDQPTDSVVMKPGELAEYVRGEAAIKKSAASEGDETSWLSNVLVFDDTPLYEIAERIEDMHGYRVEILGSGVRDIVFTGTVPLDDLDYFLKVLSRSCDVEVSKRGNQITIREFVAIGVD